MEQKVNKFELRFNNKVYYTDEHYYLNFKSNLKNSFISFHMDDTLMCRDLERPLELYQEFIKEDYISSENSKVIEFNTCRDSCYKIIYNVKKVTDDFFNLIVNIFSNDKLTETFVIPFMSKSRRDFEYDRYIDEYTRKMENLEKKRDEIKKVLLHYFNKYKTNILELEDYTVYKEDVEEWCTFTSSLIGEDSNCNTRYLKFYELQDIVEELKNE